MQRVPLTQALIGNFDAYSPELKKAARYIIDNPRDVALLSMREQARRAGVQPATMIRLVKQHGFEGYDQVRDTYADAMRELTGGFATRASAHAKQQQLEGDQALAASLLKSISDQVDTLTSTDVLKEITATARVLANARKVYCLGLRASHPVAWQMHYILSLVGEKSVWLDTVAATGADPIRHAGEQDVVFAISVQPYTQATIDVARYAKSKGVCLVVLSDSPVSPLTKLADHKVQITTESPGFYHTMAPAFALAEVLAVLVAGYGADKTLQALQDLDKYHSEVSTYSVRKSPAATKSGMKTQ